MEPSGILFYETNIFQFEVKKYACYTGVPSERRDVPNLSGFGRISQRSREANC